MTNLRAVATGVLALALLSGCGSDSDDSPGTGPADDGSAVVDPPTDDDGPDEPQPSGDATDDGSPVDDDPLDDDADGEADGVTDDDADRETDDVAAPDLVNADNYLSLTEFAVRMNVIILADRAPSPTGFIGRFPPDVDALVERAREAMQAASGSVSVSEACPLGGRYEARVNASPVGASWQVEYGECATDRGRLDGDYDVSRAPRERYENYDLEYRQDDSENGPGTTVFEAAYETGEFANVRFDVERYARDTPRDPFAVRGTGGSSLDLFSATNDRVYGSNTTIWFESEGRSIDLNVSVSGLVLEEGRAKEGTISLAAQDGSRVDVSVPDASGTVALIRTDRAGETFPDTVAWSEIYRPPE